MTDTAHDVQRKPALVAGVVTGVLIAVVFSWLFAALAGQSLGSGPVVVTFVLLVAWAVYGAVAYGPAPTEDD